jgi:hypothetical protein
VLNVLANPTMFPRVSGTPWVDRLKLSTSISQNPAILIAASMSRFKLQLVVAYFQ